MPYIIENSSGDPIVIPDSGLNQDYSIDLVGRNYSNYGEIIAKTQIDLLDNFASDATPPARPTAGQLWYDKNFKQLRVYDSTTGAWLPSRALVSAVVPTNTYGQNKAGTTYFNTATGQLYVHTGADGYQIANTPGEISDAYSGDATLSNPAFYGTSLRNIFLKDTAGVDRAVLALFYRNDGEHSGSGYFQGEKIIAVISGHTNDFVVADALSTTEGSTFNFYDQFNPVTEPNGLGLTIRPGVNVRSDSTAYSGNAYRALRADQSYGLNTGTYSLNPDGTVNDNGGVTIPASDVFHAGADSVPNSSATYDLGDPNTIFAEGYIKDLFIGEQGGTGSIQPNGDSVVNIGLELNPIDFIYVDEITVTGNINFPDGGDLGDPGNPIENIYANNVTVYETLTVDGYQLPTSAGTNGQQIYIGTAGDSLWADPLSDIGSLVSSDDSIEISSSTTTITPGGTVSLDQRTLDLTANLEFIKGSVLSIAGDSKSQESLEYDPAAGTLAYIRTTPFDNLEETDFVLVGDVDQSADGRKTWLKRGKFAGGLNIGGEVHYGSKANYPVTPDNSATIVFTTTDNSANDISITFTADAGIVANDDIVAFSDRKLKDNIEPIQDALDKVNKLTGYTFNKRGTTGRRTGVIAQEVQSVLPEAVQETEVGTLTVAYGNMVGLLIEAIKELSDEVEDLKKQLGK